jgi:RNA polymerase sigma-70 factor (ECF subfamily)
LWDQEDALRPAPARPVDRDDDALLEAHERGDAEAFGVLFERYRGRAMGYATRMLRRPELAEEVCTDTFCTVLEGRYRPTGSFRSFLFTVLHRNCLMALRRQRTRQRLSFKLFSRAEPPTPEGLVSGASEADRLHRAIDALSDDHRSVLLLFYAQELPSREVAEVLGCSDQQVRSRLAYARRKLRERLEAP